MLKEFELTVSLTKSWCGSFGFTITRSKLDNCFYVQEVLDNPAKADGRLRPGDRLVMVQLFPLLETQSPFWKFHKTGFDCQWFELPLSPFIFQVNGHNVTNVTDDVAISILRSSSKRLHMVLGRAVQNLLPPPPPDTLQDIVIPKTPSGQLGECFIVGETRITLYHFMNFQQNNKNISYSIHNDDPFACVYAGIKLTGGIGSKWQGIYVQEVVPSSPASEEGSIQPNDKIVYICGKCTLGMTLEDAVKVFESAPRKVRFKAMRWVWIIIAIIC